MASNDEQLHDLYGAEVAAWEASPEGRAWRRKEVRWVEGPDDGVEGFTVDLGAATRPENSSAERHRELIERLDRIERTQAAAVVKEAYTTAEAAEKLGRSEWTVRQWCNQGQVEEAYKVRGNGRTGEWRLTHAGVASLQARGPSPVGTHAPSRRPC